jgi:hypothetical protein
MAMYIMESPEIFTAVSPSSLLHSFKIWALDSILLESYNDSGRQCYNFPTTTRNELILWSRRVYFTSSVTY